MSYQLVELPQVSYMSWMDTILGDGSAYSALKLLVFYILGWYIVSTAPLWLSGQFSLLGHYLWILGGAGIFLVIFIYSRFRLLLNRHIANIDLVISEKDKFSYRQGIANILDGLKPQKRTIVRAFGGILFFFMLVAGTWSYQGSVIAFSFLGTAWYGYDDGLAFRILSLTIAIAPIMLILATGFHLMRAMVKVVRVVEAVDFIPSPRTCQRQVMPTLKLLLGISFAFSAFSALFIVLFQERLWPVNDFSIFYWLVVFVIIAMGMAGVIYPIYIVKKKITAIKEQRLDAITEKVVELSGQDNPDSIKMIIELYRLEEQLELNYRVESIFMGWKYISSFVLSILFPIGIALAQIYIQNMITQ